MKSYQVSSQFERLQQVIAPVYEFISQPIPAERLGDPALNDFVFGNPHEMPLPGLVDSIQYWSKPGNKDWFAYKLSEAPAQQAASLGLRQRLGIDFQPEDIALTNGAFAGLSISLATLVGPGDEVIFISPPWFFYEAMIVRAGATPVRVKINLQSFDLDLDAIRSAITPKTSAILINSPQNPTGKIHPPNTLQGLASLLQEVSQRNGRPVYLISDESYSRILFEGSVFHSPAEYYPHTLVIYTYGKTLLAPGERIGFIAIPPTMPGREHLRQALNISQIVNGWAFPNALLQYALADLEQLSIDLPHLQEKRDRMVSALHEVGYELRVPEGTFYLLVRSPLPDDRAFLKILAQHDIYCLPGAIIEMPGYFRISLTANDQMIERALPGFAAAMREAQGEARQVSPG